MTNLSIDEQRQLLKDVIKEHLQHVREVHPSEHAVLQAAIDGLMRGEITTGDFWGVLTSSDSGAACMIISVVIIADAVIELLKIHEGKISDEMLAAALNN